MDDKTELPKLKRSWIFTKIGVLLFATSIIYSVYWLIGMLFGFFQGNLGLLAWWLVCIPLILFCVVISLIGFVIDLFINHQMVVVQEKSRTNLTVRFLIWPIFFFVTFVVVWLFSGIFGVGTGILFVDISPGFGLGVLAAWFVGNLYRQTTRNIE